MIKENYRKLNYQHFVMLEIICKSLFIHYKGIRIKQNGNVILVKRYWSFQKPVQIPIATLLLKYIPEMLSIRRFGNYDVFDHYLKEINQILDQNFTDELGGISKIIDYLYTEMYDLNQLLDVSGNYGDHLIIPHPSSFITPNTRIPFTIIEQPAFINRIIEEDPEGAVASFFDWVRSCTQPKKLQIATVALFVSLNVTPIIGVVSSILHLSYKNYSYYFDST